MQLAGQYIHKSHVIYPLQYKKAILAISVQFLHCHWLKLNAMDEKNSEKAL